MFEEHKQRAVVAAIKYYLMLLQILVQIIYYLRTK